MSEKKYSQEELDVWVQAGVNKKLTAIYNDLFRKEVDFHITERLIMFRDILSQPAGPSIVVDYAASNQ